MTPDELYRDFVERYFEGGSSDVPADWPEDLRARCLFFLKVAEGGPAPAGERSVVAELSKAGVTSGVELEPPGGPPPPAPQAETGSGERYVFEGEIARGGMGRILLAYDRDFRRRIAVKVSLATAADRRRASRFLEEAQATAQLEHPNIPPVYDLGIDAKGSAYFTMRWIRGRNLKDIIAARTGELSLVRLVQILAQAAMGVHFAHTRGVIHRDLKPHNIMVGDYGEVLVVDWGLAKVLRRHGEPAEEEPPVSTARAEGEEPTLDGTVQGSLAYMAPEQAWGDTAAIDVRTDVFGLGAVLYEVLTGTPPRVQRSLPALLEAARLEEVEPPRQRAPSAGVPPQLEEAARKALALRKEDRYQSAKELHDALQAFIESIHDRERRAAEAARLRGAADRLLAELRAAEEAEARLSREEAALRAALRPHEPEERKRPLWDVSARADAAREEVDRAFNRASAAYMAVLSIDPEDRAARAALAEMFLRRLEGAEARGDSEAAALYEGLVAQYHDGRYRAELEGQGLLRLTSEPEGATVLLSRYEERRPLLVESPPEPLGATPLEVPLPRGSYLARVAKPGFAEARCAILVGRGGVVEARVRLVPEGSIPEGFVQIPGGLTIVGGFQRDLSALPRRRVHVPEVFASRFPVTFAQYCAFLADVAREGGEAWREHEPFFGAERYVEARPDGSFVPIARLDPRTPIFAVRFASAVAYCEWLGRKLGRRVRLLREEEWERCARGADGRLYPWGNEFDWALAKGGLSRPGEPFPEPVGCCPRDESPFGVRDLAGGVRELCDAWYAEGRRVTRGGSWTNPTSLIFRADWRFHLRDLNRSTDVGFRVCFDERGA